jgi:hypothetical protein
MAVTPGERCRQLDLPELPHNDAPMSCQGPLGSGSARRSVICSARCSALVRDRPMVVMTLWWPRRSRMSQVRPGGCPRVLVEPVSISTLTAGMAAFWGFSGWWPGLGLPGCGQDRDGPLRGGGQALMRSRAARHEGARGRGRPADRSKASRSGSRLSGQAVPGQAGVSRRRGGGGRPRGRRNA